MGVKFPDLKTLEGIANGIGSNMYEGFKPTPRDIELIRDLSQGKITNEELLKITIEEENGQ